MAGDERVASAILRARSGQVSISPGFAPGFAPGFDGQYGKVLVC